MLQAADILTSRQQTIKLDLRCRDMENNTENIIHFRGDRVQSLRNDLGWTLDDFEKELRRILGDDSVGGPQLSLIENGKRLPSLRVAIAMSKVLQSSMDYLCDITEFDRTSNGEDEITIVVRSESERAVIQSLAYKLLDLHTDDQKRIADLINRLNAEGKGSDIKLSNQERFERAFSTLAELAGMGNARKFLDSLRS